MSIRVYIVRGKARCIVDHSRRCLYSSGGMDKTGGARIGISCGRPSKRVRSIHTLRIRGIVRGVLPGSLSACFFFSARQIHDVDAEGSITSTMGNLLNLSVVSDTVGRVKAGKGGGAILKELCNTVSVSNSSGTHDTLSGVRDSRTQHRTVESRVRAYMSRVERCRTEGRRLSTVLESGRAATALRGEGRSLRHELTTRHASLRGVVILFFGRFDGNSLRVFTRPLLKETKSFLTTAGVSSGNIESLATPAVLRLVGHNEYVYNTRVYRKGRTRGQLVRRLGCIPPRSVNGAIHRCHRGLSSCSEGTSRACSDLDSQCRRVCHTGTEVRR